MVVRGGAVDLGEQLVRHGPVAADGAGVEARVGHGHGDGHGREELRRGHALHGAREGGGERGRALRGCGHGHGHGGGAVRARMRMIERAWMRVELRGMGCGEGRRGDVLGLGCGGRGRAALGGGVRGRGERGGLRGLLRVRAGLRLGLGLGRGREGHRGRAEGPEGAVRVVVGRVHACGWVRVRDRLSPARHEWQGSARRTWTWDVGEGPAGFLRGRGGHGWRATSKSGGRRADSCLSTSTERENGGARMGRGVATARLAQGAGRASTCRSVRCLEAGLVDPTADTSVLSAPEARSRKALGMRTIGVGLRKRVVRRC
ncbi:hypothetical protein JB92DRAFT_1212765 [Gautieria morchelliformis]|nr:hypothetical protein JB92DRAFT_1212765 [Gautieria morchelliformis]